MREPLYSQFGPQLLEAVASTLLDEINSIRIRLGMGPLSLELFNATALNNLKDTPELDCQKDDPYDKKH